MTPPALGNLIARPLSILACVIFFATLFAASSANASSLENNAVQQLEPSVSPAVTSLYPSAVAVGSSGFNLTVYGSNFVASSVVRWNKSARPTTFVSPYQLTAEISAEDVQLLGSAAVTVSNSGGGVSPEIAFTIYLGLQTNDLIYDSRRNVFWASIPSAAGALGNSIVSINPYTGVTGTPLWVGSEPSKLSLSKDGSTLWLALHGGPIVRKVDLNAMVVTPVQLYFPGGWGSNIYANNLAVSPGNPSTVAVAAGYVTIFDDATPRPNQGTTGSGILTFGDTASPLYGYGYNLLSIFTVDGTGISSTKTFNSGSYSNDLRFDQGRLYLTSGQILDATTGSLLGTFAAQGPVVPDSAVGRAFILNSSQDFGNLDQVTAFDTSTFVQIGSFKVGGLDSNSDPTSILRWGDDGIAFRTTNAVYILHDALVHDLRGTPADVAVTTKAPGSAATGANVPVTFTVRNLGPNASHVSFLARFSGGALVVSATPSAGSCAVGDVVRCDLGQITSGDNTTVSVTVIPTTAGRLKSTGLASSSLPDPKFSNNKASANTSVTGPQYNLTPILSSMSPQSTQVTGGAFTLTVNGANFVAGSTINWNGKPLATSFLDSTQLATAVDATLTRRLDSVLITVTNGSPGGGTSAALPFTLFRTVHLDTNDIVFDPFTRKLYASVPSTAPQLTGNSIVSIDPLTGKLGTPVFIGSEPTRMALSDDAQYLYVVLAGANAVRRMSLPDFTAGTQFNTVNPVFNQAFVASDVAVMPGNKNAVATCGYANGIQVWDVTNSGATPRPLTRSLVNDVYEGSVLAWGSATDLYSNDEGLSPSSLHRFSVSDKSFAETDSTYLDAVNNKITYSGGLLFAEGGGVVDPSPAPPDTPHLVGRLFATGGSSAVDTTIRRAFFLDQNGYNVQSRVVAAFDTSHLVKVGSVELDNVVGDAFDLIRWAGDGLGFRIATDFWGNGVSQVVIFRGPFVVSPSATPNPVPSLSALSPSSVAAGTANTWVTITGANFVPGATALWSGKQRTTVFVNSGQLRVAIATADLAAPVVTKLRVFNPAPGGGNSGALAFTVH